MTNLFVEFVAGSFSIGAGTYGAGAYGDTTYGQEQNDPIGGLNYTLLPAPGTTGTKPGWQFRENNLSTFRAVAAQIDDHSELLDVTNVAAAWIILDPYAAPPTVPRRSFVATLDVPNREVTYTFTAGDLMRGMYRPVVKYRFTSGREMTVSAVDDSLFYVAENPQNPVTLP